ncbi:hypothetical protein SAMN05216601_103396 [Ectopseudomonas composti]|jgi:hypothetical protein|uniref:Uncharacterized protein n=1 Tax=Ectopseudomonas composti TaxID=658457 RepID=A0A1I5L7J2_9GAMM|nr:hypothetical protein SAMN05216601_103396 [Pseudomonas composti]
MTQQIQDALDLLSRHVGNARRQIEVLRTASNAR